MARNGRAVNAIFPDDVYNDLSILARISGRSLSAVLVSLAQDFISRNSEALGLFKTNEAKFSEVK